MMQLAASETLGFVSRNCSKKNVPGIPGTTNETVVVLSLI